MEKRYMRGCEAIAESAIRAGCRFYAGYPITPQTEIPEYFAKHLPKYGGVFIQGESELASISMVTGAASAGARAMTSSSGPGLSLKSETLSHMAGSHIPAVIVNAMRGGPATGSIQGAQSDYFQATKASGHGGFRMIVLAPSNLQEAVDLTYKAFELAERDRNPVLILADGYIASMSEGVELPEFKEISYDDWDWAVRGKGTGQARGKGGSLDPYAVEKANIELEAMYKNWDKNDVMVEKYLTDDAEIIIAAFGTAARIARGTIDELRQEGYKVGMIRPITVNPFPYKVFEELDPSKVKYVLDVEMTIPAQMVYDVKLGVNGKILVDTYCRSGGVLINNEELKEKIKKLSEVK